MKGPSVLQRMRSTSTGYLVMRWVTNRIHSVTPNLRTMDRLLIFWQEKNTLLNFAFIWLKVDFTYCTAAVNLIRKRTATVSYSYNVLELFVVLQLLFVVADSLSVVAAEISIAVLHPLTYFTWELESKQLWVYVQVHTAQSHVLSWWFYHLCIIMYMFDVLKKSVQCVCMHACAYWTCSLPVQSEYLPLCG